jgi:hypothetical protein
VLIAVLPAVPLVQDPVSMSQEQVDQIKKAVSDGITSAQKGLSEAEKRFNEGAAALSTTVRKGLEQSVCYMNAASARLQVRSLPGQTSCKLSSLFVRRVCNT